MKKANIKKMSKKKTLRLKFFEAVDFLHPSGNLAVDLRNIFRNMTEVMIPNAITDRNNIDRANTFVFDINVSTS